MIRIFKHYIPRSVFWLGFIESLLLLAAIAGAIEIRYAQLQMGDVHLNAHLLKFGVFVVAVYLVALAVGMYHTDALRDLRVTIIRFGIALIISFVFMSVIFYIFPAIGIWRSIFTMALALAFIGIMIARIIFMRVADISGFKRNILVLGAGERARRIEEVQVGFSGQGFACVGFLWMKQAKPVVKDKVIEFKQGKLAELCKRMDVDEIVIAIEERRGTLPVQDLLAAKVSGVAVSDSTSFLERETGRVDLDSVNPSWLIFSEGFGKTGRVDLVFKRALSARVPNAPFSCRHW
jgi:FlaA1/EpsC-like NDP-sugar epimerase